MSSRAQRGTSVIAIISRPRSLTAFDDTLIDKVILCSQVRALNRNPAPRLRFGVIGINHSHIYGMIDAVERGGGALASVFVKEPELLAEFIRRYPAVKVARTESEVLDDESIQLVLSSLTPVERAPL